MIFLEVHILFQDLLHGLFPYWYLQREKYPLKLKSNQFLPSPNLPTSSSSNKTYIHSHISNSASSFPNWNSINKKKFYSSINSSIIWLYEMRNMGRCTQSMYIVFQGHFKYFVLSRLQRPCKVIKVFPLIFINFLLFWISITITSSNICFCYENFRRRGFG